MSGQSLSKFTSTLGQSSAVLSDLFARLAQPARARRIRLLIIGLAMLWLVIALSQLVWALFPAAETMLPGDIVILNPAETASNAQQADSVDLNKMLSWHLMGHADAAVAATTVAVPVEQATGREGIEEGAKETRLDLRLRGIVASTVDGLGHAIIEHKSKQQVYAVEDKLPVSGRVVLAKVMPDRVVLDNRGTYELLVLFEDTALSAQLPAPAVRETAPKNMTGGAVRAIDKRDDVQTTALARSYRQQLYQNPQSLAELVRITAVRDDGQLLGYKVSPGSDEAQFAQLGFKRDDLVTSVNGIALNDPGNTVRLYQLMRSAGEAVFDLERGQEQLTITVSLDASGPER
ncbi:MAG: type II secretion system protein GspC [Proteobacteria bacterium]|nr:type II secretion system protein GspC [Pseudomonadota bacterium]